jgi:zinc protease
MEVPMRLSRWTSSWSALFLAGGAAVAVAATTAVSAELSYVRSFEGIDEYRLDNGLQVLLFPDAGQSTTTVNITYLVGSARERYGETGMAHLLEHLMFKGSTHHPDVPDELTTHGSRPNGTTWYDRTNYFETFSATDENLEWAIDLEADRMVNSFLDPADLESEMTVVRNEFELGENQPVSILRERLYSTAYLWHNYGNSTIGARSDIENVPMSKIRDFYKMWYRPDNAVLVIAGRFDRDLAIELITSRLGSIQPPEIPLPVQYTVEPPQDGPRSVTLRRVGDVQEVALAYHIPAGPHRDHVPLALLAQIIGDTPTGRLHELLVEKQKATSVWASADRSHDPGLFTVFCEVPKELPVEEVRDTMIETVESPKAITQEEVDRAREQLLSGWQKRMRNTSWAAVGLSEWAAMGDWRLLFLLRDRLSTVTIEDVERVAAEYLRATNRTLGVYVPIEHKDRAEIPATPELETMLEDYTSDQMATSGEEFDATPENIESLLRRVQLPVGCKLVLLPKPTRGETVNLRLRMNLGSEESLRGKKAVGDLTASMLMRGTTHHSRDQIHDELDALQAQFYVWGGPRGVEASIQVARENLQKTLGLLVEVLREPEFSAAELEQVVQARATRLEESKNQPQAVVRRRLGRALQPWEPEDVRYDFTVDEWIERLRAVDPDDLRAFHQEFYGANSMEIAVVGDFDTDRVQRLLGELFGGWQSRTPFERLHAKPSKALVLRERIEVADKESASLLAMLPLQMRNDDPAYPALLLGNYMTGGGFLNSRLARRIRQEEGLSYSVGSWFEASRWDKDGSFGGWAAYAPANDGTVVEAFADEIRRVVADGFTAEELAAAKTGWLQRRAMSRGVDRELAGTLLWREDEERTLLWDAALEAQVAGLSCADLHSAFRRHIDPDRISYVRAGSFEGAEAPEQTTEAKP